MRIYRWIPYWLLCGGIGFLCGRVMETQFWLGVGIGVLFLLTQLTILILKLIEE